MTSVLNFVPPVIGHRGASAYAPENTMLSFVKAVQLGVKWIEFDVMLTADQQPIVFHDETLDRTTNGHGHIGRHTYQYLRTLDAGSWFDLLTAGERIPHLFQVLEFIQDKNIHANLEIKPLPGQEVATVQVIWQLIKDYYPQLLPSILFSSFSIKSLTALRQQSDECEIGLLIHHWLPDWLMICDDLRCASVNVNEEIITAENAKKIKSTQRTLLCYTVNHQYRANELFSFGVDAVFSDAPDLIMPSVAQLMRL